MTFQHVHDDVFFESPTMMQTRGTSRYDGWDSTLRSFPASRNCHRVRIWGTFAIYTSSRSNRLHRLHDGQHVGFTLASKCDYTPSTDHSKNSHNTKTIHSAKDILLIKTLPQKMNCCSHKVNLKARSVFRSCFILFFTYSYVFLFFVLYFHSNFICVFLCIFTYPLMVRMFLIFSLMC